MIHRVLTTPDSAKRLRSGQAANGVHVKQPGRDATAGKLKVYEDKAGKFRFRLKAANGQVVATGEAYETKSAAIKGTDSVQRAADGAKVVDLTE